MHHCARVAGAGDIVVFPAGTLDKSYRDKLARVDLEEQPSEAPSEVVRFLKDIKKVFDPQWILVDARTGVSEAAGNLLSGLAHVQSCLGPHLSKVG